MRPRFAPSPVILALLLGLALLVWLALGDMQRFRDTPPASAAEQDTLSRVEVSLSRTEPHSPHLVLQGQLEPHRETLLRARRDGMIAALPQRLGDTVEAGETLLELEPRDLPAQLARAEAELRLRRAELEAGQRLRGRDLVSSNELLRLESAVALAGAELANLRQARADTRIEAPFDGVLDRLAVELGDYLQPGEDIGRLVDIATLTATAWAPQRRALELSVGLPVAVTLLDGSQLQGELDFIASDADAATRSYALEAAIANPERRRIGGASATLEIALPEQQAHRLSPARLVLDEQGRLGVKHLDDADIVRFTPVTLLTADAAHAWVTGLPERIRLITLGGGFVDSGQRVTAVPANGEAAEEE